MKRLLTWAGYGLAGAAGLALLAVGGAFAASEAMVRWPAAKPAVAIQASADPGAVERGRRIAVLNGCHDCHGADFQGMLFHDDEIVRAWGPNLTLAAARQSDAELDVAIRHGVGADGRPLWIMPSAAFAQLTDAEAADLIAYVRSFPAGGEAQPRMQLSPMARLGVLLGRLRSEPATLRARAGQALPDFGPEHAQGRQVARLCVECHGGQLEGFEILKAPDLTIAAAYDPEDFATLMRTGRAAGDRDVGLMTAVSKSRFSALSESEVAALHAYLKARADLVLAQAP